MRDTVLIVEDERSIATLLQYNLEKEGFATEIAYDGAEAIKKFNEGDFDLIILDVMLPNFNGLEVCQFIRAANKQIPILMVTALDQEEDIIEGLNSGADDYISKPFSPKELIARIHAVLRRAHLTEEEDRVEKLVNGDITIYPEKFESYYKGEVLVLTKKEYELLVYFVKNKGIVLSRDQLLNAVWDYDIAGDTRIVDVHVGRLREKIEVDKKHPQYIKTIHGFGYKMEDRL